MYKKLIFLIALLFTSSTALPIEIQSGNSNSSTYWHGPEDKKEIALTFDDGPNEPYTSKILDILKANDVKATFFLIGRNAEKYPEVAKRIAAEGHAVGNHTYSHPDLLLRGGIFKMGPEIDKGQTVIEEATGVKTNLYRPPCGSGGYVEAKNRGLIVIKWSVSLRNGINEIKYNPKTLNGLLTRVQNGSIILVHDGKGLKDSADRSETVKVLPTVILYLKEKGYSFVTIPELLGLKNG